MKAGPPLQETLTPGAQVALLGENAWRFEIPAGEAGKYRVAQLDDYGSRPRRDFPWQPPFRMRLRARVSAPQLPGTWGFGLWNNPFGMAILSGVEILRLPALPDTAWFFYGSPPNYLSLRDDVPASGFTAGVFQAPRWPPALLALGAPALPLMLLRPFMRLARRIGRRIVKQDAVRLELDPTEWHTYELAWAAGATRFSVDGQAVLASRLSPRGPLGWVMWIDNQYAALPPSGRIGFGTLANPPAWMEISDLSNSP